MFKIQPQKQKTRCRGLSKKILEHLTGLKKAYAYQLCTLVRNQTWTAAYRGETYGNEFQADELNLRIASLAWQETLYEVYVYSRDVTTPVVLVAT
jgi:hypothetical protein